jgi:hypothetical protein
MASIEIMSITDLYIRMVIKKYNNVIIPVFMILMISKLEDPR